MNNLKKITRTLIFIFGGFLFDGITFNTLKGKVDAIKSQAILNKELEINHTKLFFLFFLIFNSHPVYHNLYSPCQL